MAKTKAEELLDKIRELLAQDAITDDDGMVRDAIIDAMDLPAEINTSDRMRHLAGEMMHHPQKRVRELAALALRHIEQREKGE